MDYEEGGDKTIYNDLDSSGSVEWFKSGTVIKSRFVLESLIGAGGMGQVYLAKDMRRVEAGDHDPFLAIKFINAAANNIEGVFSLLQREARRTQKLAHPNILTVYDFDRDGEYAFIVMEYVRGELLSEHIKRHPGGESVRSVRSIIAGISAGLEYSHRNNIIHRDFKPSNVFLLPNGGVKIFDFGISHTLGDEESWEATSGALTPRYASPEQFEGKEATVKDDVFAFSSVVYYLLSGTHAYRSYAHKALHLKAKYTPVPALRRAENTALRRGLALSHESRAESVYDVARPFIKASRAPFSIPVNLNKIQSWFKLFTPKPTTLDEKVTHGFSVWVADKPIQAPSQDGLSYLDYAKALFGLIDNPQTTPPLTIAINGSFGVGKSSVAQLTQYLLTNKPEDKNEKPHITAWMRLGRYRGAKDLRQAFMRDFIRDLYFKQSLYFRMTRLLPNDFLLPKEIRRRNMVRLFLVVIMGFCLYAYLDAGDDKIIDSIAGVEFDQSTFVGVLISFVLAVPILMNSILGPLKSLSDYISLSSTESRSMLHEDAKSHLHKMMSRILSKKRNLILFIDDLERSPEKTMEVLDIIETIFSLPNCVVVLPTDLKLLANALEVHNKVEDGRSYLEKYIQLQFDMPRVEPIRLFSLISGSHFPYPDFEVGSSGKAISVEQTDPFSAGEQTLFDAREEIDKKISEEGVTQFITNIGGLIPATQWDQLVDERKQRALSNSEIYKLALHTAILLTGNNARTAKRISNHVSLYIYILFHRNLIHSNSTLKPQQLGKWVAFKELWPELCDLISVEPQILAVLHKWASDSVDEDETLLLEKHASYEKSLNFNNLLKLFEAWDNNELQRLKRNLNSEPSLVGLERTLSYMTK